MEETETVATEVVSVLQNVDSTFTTESIAISAIIIVSVVLVCFVIRAFFKTILHKYEIKAKTTGKDASSQITVIHLLSSVCKAIAVILGIIFILQINGVQVSALITSVTIVTAIIGLALQDLIKDIVQGINIIADHYFNVGDVISYEGVDGKVTHISLRSTKIMDINSHDVITISNRYLAQSRNKSHMHDIDLMLAYEEDVKKIYSVLNETADKISEIPGVEYCHFKGIQDFGDSAIVYKLRMFTKPAELPELHRKAIKVIHEELDAAGIVIPYQQLDVHQKN